MALKSFGRGGGGEDDLTTRPMPTTTAPGGLTAFIDQGSEFEGKLSFRDTVRIDGRFRGEIASENTLIIGESGEIEATIRSNTVAISGSVEGDVHAARKVVLHKTARVTGNVTAPSLIVEEGAVINGTFKMVTSDGKPTGGLKAIDGGARQDAPKPMGPKPV
jgi:cytoskeletal protein CcmA (bactofilin family)